MSTWSSELVKSVMEEVSRKRKRESDQQGESGPECECDACDAPAQDATDPSVRLIPVTHKKRDVVWARVSACDYEWLSQHSWYLHEGYVKTNIAKKPKRMHKMVYERMSDTPSGRSIIDHIDGSKTNNERTNLRIATPSLNSHNRRKKLGGTSQYIGVHRWCDGVLWSAECVGQSQRFRCEASAAYWYDQLATKQFGQDANINGIKKPDNFDEMVVRGAPRHAREDKCIAQTKHGYRVQIQKGSGTCSFTSKTLEEARAWRDHTFEEMRQQRRAEIHKMEISRTADGIAFVKMKRRDSVQVLVDDDTWRMLQDHSCSMTSRGYIKLKQDTKTVSLHTLVTGRVGCAHDGMVVDHINGNKLDNRRENLRVVTSSVNALNRVSKRIKML
jgi:hypothetical protein